MDWSVGTYYLLHSSPDKYKPDMLILSNRWTESRQWWKRPSSEVMDELIERTGSGKRRSFG